MSPLCRFSLLRALLTLVLEPITPCPCPTPPLLHPTPCLSITTSRQPRPALVEPTTHDFPIPADYAPSSQQLPTPTVRHSSHAAESYESFNDRYASFFANAQDLFEVQRGLNNCFAYDLVPSQKGE